MFILFELLLILSVLYLVINLGHYFLGDTLEIGGKGNPLFSLSESWKKNKPKKEGSK